MEKIIVNPEEVRGYGNILKSTVLDDYENITSKLISGGEIEINNVLMKVYNMHPVLIEIECSKSSCFKNETISFSITVYDVENPQSAVTQNVKLYCDDILVQSKTTIPVIHNNHESAYVSFNFNTSECDVGEHIFYCEYKNIRSHKIKLIVKNPVGSITLSSNKSEAYLDENVFWTAIVKDIDGRPVVNEEVTFFNTSGYEWKRITNSDGEATMMTTTHLPSAHGYAIIIIKAKMGNKISNPVEVKFWKYHTVTLTGDNQIVAFNNNNPTSAVLTATVFDKSGDPVMGETVTFKNGNTILCEVETNGDGVATYTYTATGAGDVEITAQCGTTLSETYIITDAIYYQQAEQTFESTVSYGDHSTVLNPDVAIKLPDNCEISWKFKSIADGSRFNLAKNNNIAVNPEYSLFSDRSKTYDIGYRDTSTYKKGSINVDFIYHDYKFVRNDEEVDFYIDGVLKSTELLDWLDSCNYTFIWSYWRPGIIYVKDIIVKKL